MSIEVLNESGLELDVRRLSRLARFVMEQMRVHPQAELCIKAVDEDTIAELNGQWMEKDGPTDVLAFPMDELRPGSEEVPSPEGVLGDIVVCPQVAIKQAETAGHPAINEMLMLVTHGMLHLVGFDHADPEEEKEMFALQAELLKAFYETESA